jgi:hypothetical protein
MLRMWLIHMAFIVMVPVYFVVYQFVLLPQALQRGFPADPAPGRMFFPLFLAVSMGCVVVAWLIPRIGRQTAPRPEDDAATLLNRRVQGCIIQDACLEAVAVYGLIGLFLGFAPWQTYTLMGLGMTMLLLFSLRLLKWGEEINYRATSRPTGLAGR